VTTHRSRLCYITIDCGDLDAATVFWAAALGAVEEPIAVPSRHVYRRLRLPDSEIRVLLQHTTDPKISKERVHIDIETDDVEAEVRRLESLGATRWDHQQERRYDFWVLRDRWGNEFCVLEPVFPELLQQRQAWVAVATTGGRAPGLSPSPTTSATAMGCGRGSF
jgi:hypothetical protein